MNRPVRTRTPGGVGGEGETPSPTRLLCRTTHHLTHKIVGNER
jgi:hypothetical protein